MRGARGVPGLAGAQPAVHGALCAARRGTGPHDDRERRGPVERLHHSTVKDLDKLYMAEQLRRNPMPATAAIGVDEIAIRKGHDYRVVVSDLERQRPIRFGGAGRKQEDLAQFVASHGAALCRHPGGGDGHVETVSPSHARTRPQAEIVFDKFHIRAVRTMRSMTCAGPSMGGCRATNAASRGPPLYPAVAPRNLDLDGRQALKTLLAANQRLNTAYLLKESFGQLWDYKSGAWARSSSRTGAPVSSGSG